MAKSISWTATSRARLHHFATKHPKDPMGADRLPPVDVAWSQLRSWASYAEVTSSPSLATKLERLKREFSLDSPPSPDVEFELFRIAYVLAQTELDRDFCTFSGWAPERALAAVLMRGDCRSTLQVLTGSAPFPFWLETAGSPRTCDLKFEDQSPACFDEPEPAFCLRDALSVWRRGLWWSLRMHLDSLDTNEFVEANAVAHEIRNQLPPEDTLARGSIALAFSRDDSHAKAEILAGLATGEAAVSLALACHELDVAAVVARVEGNLGMPAEVSHAAFDFVEKFGFTARPVLEAAHTSLEAKRMNAQLRSTFVRPIEAALKLLGPA